MDILHLKNEPRIHQAVLTDDIPMLNKIAHDPVSLEQRNSLGFTAIEIARFLGKKECISILDPKHQHRRIKVQKKGAQETVKLSEAEFKAYFNVDYASHLKFSDYASFQNTLRNCPWILRSSFLGEDNRQQAYQYRNELSKGLAADVSIRWIDDELGHGLFANKNLHSGAYVGEFTGLVRRLFRRHPNTNEYCFHYPTRWWSWQYTVIDSLLEGNETRFINHSDTPNLQPLCACERSLLHIIFVTKEPIEAGTQLTYDYGKDFWKDRKKIEILDHRATL
jgi:uncharacterized protein